MPKRGASTSGSIAAVPRKKQKNIEPTNSHDDDEEQDENIPMERSSYSTQLFRKTPDVNIFLVSQHKLIIFYISFIKLLVQFFELV
jgi:hypothetical protein